MIKVEVRTGISKQKGVVKANHTSYIYTPKPPFGGGSIKWFDDNKLIRRNKA